LGTDAVKHKISWVVDGEKDNVATILENGMSRNSVVPVELGNDEIEITLKDDIFYGHKVAIKPIKEGETVFKYGLSIGRAIKDVEVGEHVHLHNIEPLRGRGDLNLNEKV